MTAHDDFQAYILSLAPLAYWTFQGLAPAALHDVTGNGHDLTGHGAFTLANATPLDGFQAASLDGVTAYFTAAVPGTLNVLPITYVSMCFPQNGPATILSNEDLATELHGGTILTGDAVHNFAFGYRQDETAAQVTLVDTVPFGARGPGFHLLVGSYDGLSATLSLDGVVLTGALATTAAVGNQTMTIGRYPNLASAFLKGFVSDTAVFQGAVPISSIANAAAVAGSSTLPANKSILAQLDKIYAAVHKDFPNT